jgi:hypothetical protein
LIAIEVGLQQRGREAVQRQGIRDSDRAVRAAHAARAVAVVRADEPGIVARNADLHAGKPIEIVAADAGCGRDHVDRAVAIVIADRDAGRIHAAEITVAGSEDAGKSELAERHCRQ